jgi:hypothetical protein
MRTGRVMTCVPMLPGTFRTVQAGFCQLSLKSIVEQLMPMLAQEHKQLRPPHALITARSASDGSPAAATPQDASNLPLGRAFPAGPPVWGAHARGAMTG